MDKTKIIVVEDNIVYCEYVCNMLSREGYHTMKNISNNQVPVKTVDIGLAQLAMHSVYETTGAKDTESLVKAATVFFA